MEVLYAHHRLPRGHRPPMTSSSMPAARCQHLLDLLAQVEAGWLVWVVIESAGESVVTADGAYWRRSSDRVRAGELPPQGLITGDPSGSSGTLPIAGEIRVFVAMSFREEEEPALVDYWQAMLRAAEKARRDFQLTRVDEVEGDYEIVEQFYREIDAAHLVIADLTLPLRMSTWRLAMRGAGASR
jgi:hypothetical protein